MERSGGSGSYRDLTAWQKAMDLVEQVYLGSRNWPKEEAYGLTSQVRRAAISVPSNIAEGQGRDSTKEFLHHLSMARGSILELETQILVAERLGYVDTPLSQDLLRRSAEVSRLVSGLMRSMKAKLNTNN
jgi:four helix bundle protein